jgi:hypothetical protein
MMVALTLTLEVPRADAQVREAAVIEVAAQQPREAPSTMPPRIESRVADQLAPAASPAREATSTRTKARPRHNAVTFETLGNGGLYSLNYARTLWRDVTARVGISYMGVGAGVFGAGADARAMTVPLTLNYLGVGSPRNRLELGAGTLMVYASGGARFLRRSIDGREVLWAGSATLGYRYLGKRGLTLSFGFTPIFTRGFFLPWGGFGFGYMF